jgi:hypothetical protein
VAVPASALHGWDLAAGLGRGKSRRHVGAFHRCSTVVVGSLVLVVLGHPSLSVGVLASGRSGRPAVIAGRVAIGHDVPLVVAAVAAPLRNPSHYKPGKDDAKAGAPTVPATGPSPRFHRPMLLPPARSPLRHRRWAGQAEILSRAAIPGVLTPLGATP